MPDFFVSVVPFQLANAIGNQTITDPRGLGKTPKAAVFIVSGATALDTITSTARISIGMTDGTTQRACAYMAENLQATATADTGYRTDTASIMQMTGNNAQGLDVSASFVSFGTDAVTINVDVARQFRGYVVLFYGSLLQANVTSFAAATVIGTTANTTAPGFTPDCIIAFSVGQAFTSLGAGDQGMMCSGFAARSPSITPPAQGCAVTCAEDRAVAATSTGVLVRNDAIISQLTSSAGTVTEGGRLEVSSFDTNGFTITTRNLGVALEAMYLSLRVNGVSCWAGASTVTAGSTGNKSLTNPGFKPLFVMASTLRASAANTLGSTQGSLSVGAADTVITQAIVGINDRDNLATSSSQSVASSANIVDVVQTSSTHDWIGDFVSFDATGWTLHVSSASLDAADRAIAYLAIESPTVFTQGETVGITETFPFVTKTIQLGETVGITETSVLVESSLQVSETVGIAETSVLVESSLQLSETETITETSALVESSLQVSETVAITETSVLVESTLELEETVGITETSLLIESSLQLSETVGITESTLFVESSLQLGETVTIGEDVPFFSEFIKADETVTITEGTVFMLAIPAALVVGETVGIADAAVLSALTVAVTMVANETVGITEGVSFVPGTLLTVGETVQILDGSDFGAGTIARKATFRAKTYEESS